MKGLIRYALGNSPFAEWVVDTIWKHPFVFILLIVVGFAAVLFL